MMGDMEPIIRTSGLTRHFGNTVAVADLNLEIGAGEVFGFLGHNGAGKTTTVRLLNGILKATQGEARLFGLDPISQGAQIRQQTGVLTETPSLDDRLTPRSTLRTFAHLYNVPKTQVEQRVETLLQTFGLEAFAEQKIGGFSKGTRQRVALARTLLHDPKLIFLDEPSTGLDPVAIRDVHRLIQQLTEERQRTVFLCTHNLVEAQKLCHRVAVMAKGQLLAVGTPRELTARYSRSQRVKLRIGAGQETALPRLLADCPQINFSVISQRNGSPEFPFAAPLITNWDNTLSNNPLSNGYGCDRQTTQITLQGVTQAHLPDFLRHLTGHGLDLFAVEPEEASLEDVYFALQEI
jgi:ABC-2 type transport system ATP-binding protein